MNLVRGRGRGRSWGRGRAAKDAPIDLQGRGEAVEVEEHEDTVVGEAVDEDLPKARAGPIV
jgi:hypothetical protein